MEPQEVPPLIYQLLFLCDVSHHMVPLHHLANYFQNKLKTCEANTNKSINTDSMDIDSDIIGKIYYIS